MIEDKKNVTKSVRIDLSLNLILEALAKYERRTMSNIIQLFLLEGAERYIDKRIKDKDTNFAEFFASIVPVDDLEKLKKQTGFEIQLPNED